VHERLAVIEGQKVESQSTDRLRLHRECHRLEDPAFLANAASFDRSRFRAACPVSPLADLGVECFDYVVNNDKLTNITQGRVLLTWRHVALVATRW